MLKRIAKVFRSAKSTPLTQEEVEALKERVFETYFLSFLQYEEYSQRDMSMVDTSSSFQMNFVF